VRGVLLRSRAGARHGRGPLFVGFLAILLAGAAGCRHKSKTPEEAYRRFAASVTIGDGGALFDALDQETRWALMTIQKWHREAYDIVLSNYPEGPERERETHRFERAATASSARDLFRVATAPRLIPMLRPLLLDHPSSFEREPGDDQAAAVLPNGGRIPFARGKNGGWGFAGLAPGTLEDKNRAYHDLEVVRASAADYERAAARAAK
jgi:hypothetical protein